MAGAMLVQTNLQWTNVFIAKLDCKYSNLSQNFIILFFIKRSKTGAGYS